MAEQQWPKVGSTRKIHEGEEPMILQIPELRLARHVNFPRPGEIFWDWTRIMYEIDQYECIFEILKDRFKNNRQIDIEIVVGIESMGFLLGPRLAVKLFIPFVPMHYAGRHCDEAFSQAYQTDRGPKTLSIAKKKMVDGGRYCLVDDQLRTGRTLEAACKLIRNNGGEVVQIVVLIEFVDLNGRSRIPEGIPIKSMFKKTL